jgi:hypothetical protein
MSHTALSAAFSLLHPVVGNGATNLEAVDNGAENLSQSECSFSL